MWSGQEAASGIFQAQSRVHPLMNSRIDCVVGFSIKRLISKWVSLVCIFDELEIG